MRKSAIILWLSIIALPSFTYDDKKDLRGNSTENFASQGAVLTITADKSRYSHDENITLNLKLHNKGTYPVTFYLNRNYLRNFTIIARDEAGTSLPMKDITYFKEYKDYRDPFFREYTGTAYHSRAITIQPGESFERNIKLQDVINLNSQADIQKLDLAAFFYPNPVQNPRLFISSANRFSLLVEGTSSARKKTRPVMPARRPSITPREAVFLALSAEFTRDWPNFFKYFSLRDIIKDYPVFARQYISADSNRKPEVLESFRRFMMDTGRTRLLQFNIEGAAAVSKNRRLAEVKVKAVRLIEGFKREFLYTYYLSHSSDFWQITGVQTQLLK